MQSGHLVPYILIIPTMFLHTFSAFFFLFLSFFRVTFQHLNAYLALTSAIKETATQTFTKKNPKRVGGVVRYGVDAVVACSLPIYFSLSLVLSLSLSLSRMKGEENIKRSACVFSFCLSLLQIITLQGKLQDGSTFRQDLRNARLFVTTRTFI